MNRALLTFLLIGLFIHAQGQRRDSLTVNTKRLSRVAIISGIAYTGTMVALGELWYKNSDRQSFEFFNDNAEWKQVDKVGHFYTSFYLSYGAAKGMQWSNIEQRRAAWLGAASGFLLMLPIEVFDGFSDAYGASAGDLVANGIGSAFFLGQTLVWQETRIQPKFSFHRTAYAPLRPSTLGENYLHELLKDYNGQTYWLSVDMDKFMPFPKWLNLAVGYGAEQMVYARNSQNETAGYSAYRQYYVALDFDLTGIKTKSKTLKTLFALVSMVKLPAPTVAFSHKSTKFHPLYF